MKAVGLRAGRVAAHASDAQKPGAQRLISILRGIHDGTPCPRAPEGAGSFAIDTFWTDEALLANGYLRFGARAVRADLAERLAWEVSKRRRETGRNAFAIPSDLASVVSCPGDAFPGVLKGLGLVPAERDPETKGAILWRYASRANPGRRTSKPAQSRAKAPGRSRNRVSDATAQPRSTASVPTRSSAPDPDSPFAALAVLVEPEREPERKRTSRRRRGKAVRKGRAPATSGFTYRPFE